MKSFKREIIETGDGSKTFYLPQLDETYHSHHGAYNESLHIFINNGLKPINKSEVNIFEVGFGTGLNAILTLIHKGSKNINYDGIELYPVHLSDLNQIDYKTIIASDYHHVFDKMHEKKWGMNEKIADAFNLRKIQADFTVYDYDKKYDLVYFDAFAPNKQEEMWTLELLQKLYNACNNGAVLVTYCVRGTVKRALKEVGFQIEKLPGPKGGKREMLRAFKR